jgi:hypothetical protein
MSTKATKEQSEEFLQGFACGWCLLLDMMRTKGMEELPHPAGQGMVAFSDTAEAYFQSSGLGKLLGPYQTQEIREVLLKSMLEAQP